MAGIWGRESEGACSIVLSGGYEDDIDDLNYIRYTGQGGQDKPGGKQVKDQEYIRGNKALVLSSKYNLPVRVIRGFQIPNGPDTGYRYDGLYYVNKFERIKGQSGYYICRFHLSSEKEIEKLENELKPTLKSDYKRTERASATVNRLKRNIKLSEEIKKIYDYKCQICDIYLKTPYGGIAIGAHIKGLGKPHNGPDVIENMMCLCPNHHEQFDDYGYYIDPETLEIKGLENYEEKKIIINKKHKIDKDLLDYHFQQYKKNN
jgi:putative restriction endonuclease